jgi:hypothetical protein
MVIEIHILETNLIKCYIFHIIIETFRKVALSYLEKTIIKYMLIF